MSEQTAARERLHEAMCIIDPEHNGSLDPALTLVTLDAEDLADMRPLIRSVVTDMRAAADRIETLETAIQVAVREIRDEHRPMPGIAPGMRPRGCLLCWPSDSSWPCVTELVADDLTNALDAEETA